MQWRRMLMSTSPWKEGKTDDNVHKWPSKIADCPWADTSLPMIQHKITRNIQHLAWIFSEEWQLAGLYIEKKWKKMPQWVIELDTSCKIAVARANSITLNSCTESRVVVHYWPSFLNFWIFESF